MLSLKHPFNKLGLLLLHLAGETPILLIQEIYIPFSDLSDTELVTPRFIRNHFSPPTFVFLDLLYLVYCLTTFHVEYSIF